MRKKNMKLDEILLSLKEIWQRDKRLILVLITEIFINALRPFPNIIFAGLIADSIIEGRNFQLVIAYVVLLFGSNFFVDSIGKILAKIKEYLFIKLTNEFVNDIDQKCLNMDYEQFNDVSMQNRITLVNQIVRGNNFCTSLNVLSNIISQIITLLGILGVISMLDIWLLVIAVVASILQALLHYIRLKYDRKYKEDSSADRRKYGYVSQLVKDVQSKKDIVMYGMSDYLLKKSKMFQQSMLVFQRHHIKTVGIIEIIIYTLSVVFQIAVYLIIGANAFGGKITIGDFTRGTTALISFMSISAAIITNIMSFNENVLFIRQYKSFLKLKSKYDVKSSTITLDDIDLNNIEIEFRNVSFRYPNSTSFVLKDINIKINNSERWGIVGYNGAGKTTFTLLLTRMYDPTEGAIYLNGIDIRDIDYCEYQKILSSVNQDFSLLAFSIMENIAISDTITAEDQELIWRRLCENGLSDRLKKLYRGIDTPITKILSASGVDLSGGERQKIAIVRALYKEAPILILDEPTSALDPVAEHEVFKSFAEMSEGKTTIFISHRIYSTRFCDKIVVFDKGQIKECGTFDELMCLKGLYYEFFQQQADCFK